MLTVKKPFTIKIVAPSSVDSVILVRILYIKVGI